MAHLAWRAIDTDPVAGRWVVWVHADSDGLWVNPRLLCRGEDTRLLERSLVVRARDEGERLWAIDLALRSPAVSLVVADGGGLKMSATRRLQLSAAEGDAVALLARPVREISTPSAAATRWRLQRRVTQHGPGWTVELLRCKGSQPARASAGREQLDPVSTGRLEHLRWMLEWDGAKGALIIPPDVVDRPGRQDQPAERVRVSRTA